MRVTIMMGIPGSGKSTWVEKNRRSTGGVAVVSADNYFTANPEGVYKFDPRKLGEAHAQCMRAFVTCLLEGWDVVVDNTNTTLVEIAPYIAVSRALGAGDPEIKALTCDWVLAAERNTHGVPGPAVERMAAQMAKTLTEWPPFWPKVEAVS